MLVPDIKTLNIGKVKFGKVHQFTYTLYNDADEEAIIKKIVVSCSSCTVATVNKKKVLPGDTVEVKVSFTPGTISKQSKHIDVLYDNTGVRLEFIGESYE